MKILQNYVLDFINKYPAQAHILAVVLVILTGIFEESKTAQALVASVIPHIPHGATVAEVLGGLILWYTKHEK